MLRRALVIVAVVAPAAARADAWRAGVEGGIEWDSNVHRVEVDPDRPEVAPVAAPLARAGGRVDGAGEHARWGRWALAAQGLVRATTPGEVGSGEDIAVGAFDGRWDRALGDRRVRVGARATYYDVVALLDGNPRAFASGAADAVVSMAGEGGARVVVTAGARDFRYKPDADFDWRGVALAARLVRTVWRARADDVDLDLDDPALAGLAAPAADAATLDLAVGYRLERRAFTGLAFASGCDPGAPVEPACFVPTGIPRADLHHVGEVEAAYTGEVVATAGYQLTVNDSTSYGQSLVRHRATVSATAEGPARVFATVIATLQLDQYLDPLLLAQDVSSQQFTSIDDENRSAISVRLSRRLGSGVTAEARWAYYGDSLSSNDRSFRRQVVYGGLTWTSDE